MGSHITNLGNTHDDDSEVYVTIDPRAVILDLPGVADVASLRRVRGQAGGDPLPLKAMAVSELPLVAPRRPLLGRWPLSAQRTGPAAE